MYKLKSFDITPQHLGQVIRDDNKTRKGTRHEHFPKERYKKPTIFIRVFSRILPPFLFLFYHL